MKRIVKVSICLAIMMALVMNIVPVRANTFMTATKRGLNAKYKIYYEYNETQYIKIKIKKKGIYKINVKTDCFGMRTHIYKSNGKEAKVILVGKKESQGTVTKDGNFLYFSESDVTEYCNVTVSLKLKKGTYVIKYDPCMGYYDTSDVVKIKTSFKKSKR